MWGVSADLDLSFLVDRVVMEVLGVGVGQTILYIGKDEARVSIECQWELLDPNGDLRDCRHLAGERLLEVEVEWQLWRESQADEGLRDLWPRPEGERGKVTCALYDLVGRVVVGYEVSVPDTVNLRFDNGMILRLTDSSKEFESFEIYTVGPGQYIVV